MLWCVLIAITFTSIVRAQDGEIAVSSNKTQCINALVQWCNNMQYPQQGVGMTMLSVTYQNPSGFYRVYCYSDSDGSNCTRNGNPWFTCSSSNILTYKGNPLTASSTDVDDEICNTTDKAFNELFVQNLSYNTTTMKEEVQKGMEAFFSQMAEMAEQIEELQKRLRDMPFLGHDFWGGDDFDFRRSYFTTLAPSDTRQIGADDKNVIERE